MSSEVLKYKIVLTILPAVTAIKAVVVDVRESIRGCAVPQHSFILYSCVLLLQVNLFGHVLSILCGIFNPLNLKIFNVTSVQNYLAASRNTYVRIK